MESIHPSTKPRTTGSARRVDCVPLQLDVFSPPQQSKQQLLPPPTRACWRERGVGGLGLMMRPAASTDSGLGHGSLIWKARDRRNWKLGGWGARVRSQGAGDPKINRSEVKSRAWLPPPTHLSMSRWRFGDSLRPHSEQFC